MKNISDIDDLSSAILALAESYDTVLKLHRIVLERAVHALVKHGDKLEALALIRGAYRHKDGGPVSVEVAKLILKLICE